MIPIRIDKHLSRTPWINYGLILANAAIFLFFQRQGSNPAADLYMLHPDQPELYQFFTSAFLHAGWEHLIGNMIFLWVFGNAVNDSFGHVGYLAFYLAGGVIAGVGYVLLTGTAPVLGASGAISAVTGAFLVLFPRVRVTVLVIVGWIFPMELPSLLFLALQFGFNLWLQVSQASGGVAYVAHLSGYVFGIGIAATLLATKLLPRDVYDLLSLARTWRRKREYRKVVADGYDPFGYHRTRQVNSPPPRWSEIKTVSAEPVKPMDGREFQVRQDISARHAAGDFPAAATQYLSLVQLADNAVLPLPQQLDIANYLMSSQQYPAAADAYERFVKHYPQYEYIGDVWLMLGLIYSRYLQQDALAQTCLDRAGKTLTDAHKAELARQELDKVRRRLGT